MVPKDQFKKEKIKERKKNGSSFDLNHFQNCLFFNLPLFLSPKDIQHLRKVYKLSKIEAFQSNR